MNILIAPNSMKGSLNAFDFSDTVEKAFLDCSHAFKTKKVPVADGGDFTGEVLQRANDAEIIQTEVIGPLGKKVQSKFAVYENTAIIEMADASGMKLVEQSSLNPLKATSYGTGQLIQEALKNGCTEILLAIGGSATVDGGMGMMEALGFEFFDVQKKKLSGNGSNLSKIHSIRTSRSEREFSIKIICDVDNPLLGENGAAAVFGPQKGATPEMVIQLEKGLKNWSEILRVETGKDLANIKGTGAAGGLSVPLLAFFETEIVEGANFVLSKLDFNEHLKWADMVITGEGKIDSQTLSNKAPYAVALAAKKLNIPVYAFAGIAEKLKSEVFDGIYTLVNEKVNKEMAINNSMEHLYDRAFEFAKSIKI